MESMDYWVLSVMDLLHLLLHFAVGAALLFIGLMIYTRLTPYHEIEEIRQGNPAAGVALFGACISMALPIAAAIANTAALVGLLFWGTAAILVQSLVFFGVAKAFRDMPEKIREGEVASGLKLAGAQVSVGILNAATIAG